MVVATEWEEIHTLDLGRVAALMEPPSFSREQLRISLDPNAVDRTLGWRPDTNLSAGLKQTLSFFDAL